MGEPLYQDLCGVFRGRSDLRLVGGRYGLASKDTTPAQLLAVFENLKQPEPKDSFTVGITDDVSFTSLPLPPEPALPDEGLRSCKFWGLGSDGTVGANKNSIKIIGDNTDLYTQAYFVYDSKKSGGLTQSHLRFGPKPIRKPYLVSEADFVACHNVSYLDKYDIAKDIRPGGVFLLNCSYDAAALEAHLPGSMKRQLAEKRVRFYTIDATRIARELGLGNRSNAILQAAFFELADIIPMDAAMAAMKKAVYDSYYVKRGQAVVDMNCLALERGVRDLVRAGRAGGGRRAPRLRARGRRPHEPAGGRRPARVGVQKVREHRRHLARRHHEIRKARHGGGGPGLGQRQVPSVQPVLPGLPPRGHPPLPAGRERARGRARGLRDRPGQGRQGRLRLPAAALPLRLHRLRQLRQRLPGKGEGALPRPPRDAARRGRELGFRRRRGLGQAGRGGRRERQELAVPQALF